MALTITSLWLPQSYLNTPYSFQLGAANGVAPFTWSFVPGSGALPSGLTISTSGLLAGTPTSIGLYTFTVQLVDSTGAVIQLPMSFTSGNTALTLNTAMADQYSNSYVDVPYCSLYWAEHYNMTLAAQWTALTTQQQTMLLLQACRVLETVRFTSVKNLAKTLPHRYDRHSRLVMTLEDQPVPTKWLWTQRLQFPRNLDHDYVTGALYVPEPILMAQCEQALYTLNFDATAIANRMQGVTQDLTYVGNIHLRQNLITGGSMYSPVAMEMARPYMLATSYQVRRQ